MREFIQEEKKWNIVLNSECKYKKLQMTQKPMKKNITNNKKKLTHEIQPTQKNRQQVHGHGSNTLTIQYNGKSARWQLTNNNKAKDQHETRQQDN